MLRALPWMIAAIAMVALGTSLSEFWQMRARFEDAAQRVSHNHTDARQFVILSQLAQAKNPIILISDSIGEGALLPSSICGYPIVNASIGGITAQAYLPFAREFMPAADIALTVVALGTNEASNEPPQHAALQPSYGELIDLIRQHSAKLVIAGIPPFDMSGELAKAYFDPANGDRNDAAIRKAAETRDLSFIDLRHDIRGDHLSRDGIHFNAAGYTEWRDDIVSHIRSSIGCSEATAR